MNSISIDRRSFLCGCCGALAASTFACTGASAQNPQFSPPPSVISPEQHYENLRAALRGNATAAVTEFRKYSNSDTNALINQISFRFRPEPINNARAFIDPSTSRKIVEIYTGAMMTIEQISLCRAFSVTEIYKDQSTEYLQYVAEWINDRKKDPQLLVNGEGLKSFFEFIDLTEQNDVIRFYQKNPLVRTLFEGQVEASVAFLVGHEIGHHLLGHTSLPTPSLAESRKREEYADQIAIRLTAPTRMKPSGAVPILISFVLMDPEAHLHQNQLSHPDPKQRILKAVQGGIDAMLEDADFVDYLHTNGKYDEFVRTYRREIAEFKRMLDQL